MIFGIVGLAVAFFVVTLLLLSLNLRSDWPWYIKAGAILLTGWLWIVTYFTIADFSGRPAYLEFVPEDFTYVWSVEVEPDKRNPRSAGSIYMLIIPDGENKPRLFEVPYDYELHKQLNALKVGICKGGKKFKGQKTKNKSGKKAKNKKEQNKSKFRFYLMPTPVIPPKTP